MMWHKQFRQTEEPHGDHWYQTQKKTLWRNTSEDIMMSQFCLFSMNFGVIQFTVVQIQGCTPRNVHKLPSFTNDTAERHKEDFETLHETIDEYLEKHRCIPYCVVLQALALRYLGAGLIDADFIDKHYPYRSSKSFSCMFWILGNWQRFKFAKDPLPEHLEKYRPHIKFDFNPAHKLIGDMIGDRPLYNNFFVNVVKNLRSHLFMNCEAASIYEHRARIEEGGYRVCFNDYQDLIVAARVGKDGSVRQIAGYKTDPDDTRPRFVSWAIFEMVWGTTLNRHLEKRREKPTRARMSMHRA